MEQSRLYRSARHSVIAGVCGGLGDYLNTDPVLFRVLFLVTAFIGGGGLLVYIVLWIVVPLEDPTVINPPKNMNMEEEIKNSEVKPEEPDQQKNNHKNQNSIWGGLILITLGALFLIDRFVPRIHFGDLWPVILIVIGIVLISKSFDKST